MWFAHKLLWKLMGVLIKEKFKNTPTRPPMNKSMCQLKLEEIQAKQQRN